MIITELKQDFIKINANGMSINDLNLDLIYQKKVTLLRNLNPFSSKEYVELAQRFGKILPYNNQPIFSFSEKALDEVELHYDGVSANNIHKIPDWLLFHVEKPAPIGSGGSFRVADSENVLKKISSTTYQFIKKNKLQFFNYLNKDGHYDKLSFEIDAIRNINGRESLRIFLPSIIERSMPDSKKIFSGASEKENEEIFLELRSALYSEEIIQYFSFEKDDLLILNNRFTFHGRERFSYPVDRILNRIQTLPGEHNEFGQYF